MTAYLLAACSYLKVEPDKVLVYRQEGDEVVLVVDNGIKGCPKYRVPLSRLQPETPVGQHTNGKPGQTEKRRARR